MSIRLGIIGGGVMAEAILSRLWGRQWQGRNAQGGALGDVLAVGSKHGNLRFGLDGVATQVGAVQTKG